jgi:high frequency lysogenization protein
LEKSWKNVAIGLAGVFQATALVERLAKTGYLDTAEFETAVRSIFEQNPPSAEAVFGGTQNLVRGLETLVTVMGDHRNPAHGDILRYTLGVFHVQKKLSKKPDMLQILGTRIEKAKLQAEHFGLTHDNVVANLAGAYTDTISTFQYRIQVTGEFSYLQQTRVANQVRVLLLAAIRAATLWRQAGGSRWQLLLSREKITAAAQELLQEARQLQAAEDYH